MSPEEFARNSWQGEATSATLPPLEELRAKADKFRRRIVWRNAIEYGAGVFVIVTMGAMMLFGPLLLMRIGAGLAIAGVLYVLWQLHRRGSPLTPMHQGGQLSVLEYRRRELARQHAALDSIFSWYLAPLIPGILVIAATPWLAMPVGEWQLPPLDVALRLAYAPALFLGVYFLNKRGARRLQREIDEIDALSR